MTKRTIKIHDVETGEVIERDMTVEEIEAYESDLAERQALINAQRQSQAEMVTKRAEILDKLGITEEEAKLLLS